MTRTAGLRKLASPVRAKKTVAWAGWLAALIACVLANLEGGRIGVAAGSFLVALVGLPAMLRLRRDHLDAVGLYAVMAVLSFGLLSLLWLVTPAVPAPGVDRDDVARALLIVAGGLGAFVLAARLLGPAVHRSPLRYRSVDGPPPALLVALFALAAAATAAGLAIGAVGYTADPTAAASPYAQVFVQVSGLGAAVVLVCAMQAFGAEDRRARRLLPILLGAQIVAGFVAGFKGASLLPVVYTGLAYVACSGTVPWRALMLVIAVTVGFLLPANVAYRALLRENAGSSPAAVLDQAQRYVSSRFRLIDHVALIDARTPDLYSYGDGSRYLYLPALVLVPRALWPEKPVLDDGRRFSRTYWELPPRYPTSTPLTQAGDLLRNFRLPGVAIGLAVWGLVVAAFLRLCRSLRSPRAEMVYTVSLVAWITYVEQALPDLVTAMSRTLPVTVALAWLLLPGRSRPAGHRILVELIRGLSSRFFVSRRQAPMGRRPGL